MPVAHQATGCGELPIRGDHGHRVAERQCGEPFASAIKKCMSTGHEPARLQSGQGCEDGIEVAFVAGVQDGELKSKRAGHRLHVSRQGLHIGTGRVHKERNDGCRGDHLVQQLQPLRPYLFV